MIERDKFLTEAILGGVCEHELSRPHGFCIKCQRMWPQLDRGYIFSTWTGFGKLWEFCQEQEWWQTFIFVTEKAHPDLMWAWCPDTFANAVYEYLKDRRTL